MIGLGSNRLTVCRRGGMSVTQAGRGGMEWLAGGRVPDWVTPYSAQATAWLRENYPDQWDYLVRYGITHPEVVPLINENPMYAFSWLYNQSGLVFKMDCGYKCTTQKWIDEINGLEFIGNGSVALTDGIPTFGGSASYLRSGGSNHAASSHTIEIVFYPTAMDYTHIYSEGSQGNILASYLGAGSFVNSMGTSPIAWNQTAPLNALNIVSAAGSERAYANLIAIERKSVGGSYWSAGGTCQIGARASGGNNFKGKIYAIRIYNRLLTEQEILANQAIDLQRWQAS